MQSLEQRERRKMWLLHEITMGNFERSITFSRPVDAGRIETKHEHGLLTLKILFSQSSRSRKINISGQNRQEQIPVSSNTSD